MTTAYDIDWPAVLAERLITTHPDVLRELLSTFIHTLMGTGADVLCGAEYGQRSTTSPGTGVPGALLGLGRGACAYESSVRQFFIPAILC